MGNDVNDGVRSGGEVIFAGQEETPKRKTDEEIRERIAMRQREAKDEELNGLIGGEDWNLAMTAECELRWVLGE